MNSHRALLAQAMSTLADVQLLTSEHVTMHAAPGVGVAAPQVGVELRIAVIEDPAPVPDEVRVVRGRVPQPFRVLVNPSYEPVGEGRVAFAPVYGLTP